MSTSRTIKVPPGLSAVRLREGADRHHRPLRSPLVKPVVWATIAGKHPFDELNGHIQLALDFFEDRFE